MERQDNKKPPNHTVLHISFMILMFVLGTVFAINVGKIISLHNLYLNANYVEEYATIIRYEEDIHRGNFIDYITYYEYVSPDGTIYTGLHEARIKTEEEAKAQIGKKIKIYIDHELKLQKKVYPLGGAWFNGVVSIVCFGIFSNSLIRVILFIKKWRKYKQSLKDIG